MKNRSQIGNKQGNPAYRTASAFRARQFILSSFSRKKTVGFAKISKPNRGGGFQKINPNRILE